MSKHKIKRIVSLVSVIGLSACNGGTSSDNNVSPQPQPKPPSPSSNEIKVPLSMQVGTPVSIHSKENSGTKSLQSLKSLTVNNECLELVTNADDGKNYKTEVNSSQYWSTAKITFSIKNKCNSPTALSNVAVLVNGFNINGNKVTSLGDVSQTGSPYMAIKTSGDSVIINTPECNDEHCNWAKLPAGAEHKFTISSSVSAPISSVGVQSVSFDEIPPSPTPTPDPQPVDKTGEFSLHIDASSLKDICGKQACTAEINIGVPSGQSGIDKISFNPAESTIIDRVYSNLLPGNYTLQVNNGNLPKDTTFDYGNGSGTVSIAAGSKAKAQINFKHSDVVAPADVTFAIGGISDLAKFTAISSVEADVTSETTGKVYKLSLPLGSGISLNGIPVNDTYTIKTQSIANPEEGIFYKGVNLSGVKFNAGVNSKTLTFTKVITAPKVITFNVNGLENGNQLSVLLADSGTIDPGFYIYTPAKSVVNGSKLKFVDGTVAININNAPTGYTLNSDYQKVVNDSATINLTLTKDNVTPVVTDKINATYWALWGDNTSYPIGGVPHPSVPVDAQDIDKSVNLIIASFIVTDANGDYVLAYKDPGKEGPSYYTDDQLLSMIKKVKEQKRKMIISLGGEKFHLHMKTPEDKQRFVTQTEKIIDKFGFDGIDLDLEAGAVSEDPNLLASAVLEIANKYRVKGQDFLITMAPEWGYITPYRYGCGDWGSGSYQNSFYIDLVKALGMNNISYIMPQTYNQGPANGVCGPDKTKVVPADGTDKFIAAMAWAISNPTGYNLSITGVSGSKMPLIPANKLVMGIPATVGAAGGEMAYVLTPTQIKSSYKLAVSYGAPFAGYFTWAADWDNTPYSNSALGFTHAKWDSAKAIYEAITGTTPPAPTPDPTPTPPGPSPEPTPPGPTPTGNQGIVGYWGSWSTSWGDANTLGIANIPSYVNTILISFVQPSCNHTAGRLDCGLQFSMDMATVRGAIDNAHKKNPNQKFLLSIGGANYPFSQQMTQENANSLVALMNEMGADGLDLDYETQPKCTGLDTAQIKCNTDDEVVKTITLLKNALPKGKMLTAATWSVGAYGNDKFPVSKYLPQSNYAGMFINPLKQVGNLLDEIYIMSYDAGTISSTGYNPKEALMAYADIYPISKTYLGLEIPYEAWPAYDAGGNILTVLQGVDYASYVKQNGAGGVMLWSLNKISNVNGENANDYLKPICNLYGLAGCTKDIPIK